MKNLEIRARAVERGVKLWQVADELGIADTSLSRKLRSELSPHERDKILAIIERLSKTGGKEGVVDAAPVSHKSREVRDRLCIEKITYKTIGSGQIKPMPNGDHIDLCAAERVEMKAGEFKIIPLGVAMQLPEGYEAHVLPRSSTFKRWGILMTNSMGIIDNSYCGDNDIWGFPALAMRDTVIEAGDRIAQFRIVKKMPPVQFQLVDKLGNEDRGGFGSTGVS